jgi:glycosyltransferase involved in cell wall biosynthesis
MRHVLLISPHFPPDSTAATHRVRLLAPYLSRYGWEPTVLTCRADAYEGTLDPALPALLPASLRVVRCAALPARWTRRIGIGDLGLRSFGGLLWTANRLLRTERFDALFITIFPAWTALLGPLLVRRFGIPFVLDYQDPWVSAWGSSVGGGRGGRVDLKSRASRRLATWLEPHAVRAASAITAVSSGTYEPILARYPDIQPITAAIPVGADPRDFATPPTTAGRALPFDPADGLVHICYTGTILPLGLETLDAFLRGVAHVRSEQPALYARMRLHFVGTSNQTTRTDVERVMPLARRLGVDDVVDEFPTRLPYSQILEVQRQASVLVALGSSEPHYTASKIFPLLLARRPLVAIYHEQSSVVALLRSVSRPQAANLVTYSDADPVGAKVPAIAERLAALAEGPTTAGETVDLERLGEYLAENLAGRLAEVLDRVAVRRAA